MSNNNFKYNNPSWKEDIDFLNSNFGYIDIKSAMEYEQVYNNNEVGLRHQLNGAGLTVRDDGCIDIFADESTGIRIDPNTQSITLIADNINSISKVFNLRTKPDGFRWNLNAINPELYSTNKLQLHGQKAVWSARKQEWNQEEINVPVVKQKFKSQELSDDIIDIMKDLGLPT